MAISYTVLTSGSTTPSGSSFVTPSISPGANKLILAIGAYRVQTDPGNDQTTVAGNGLTWVRMVDRRDQGLSGWNRVLTIYRAMGASPSSGAVTFTKGTGAAFSGDGAYAILEFDGINTGGTNGSAAVGLVNDNSHSSITFAAQTVFGTPAVGDVSFAVVSVQDGTTITGDANWDNIISQINSNEISMLIQWDVGQDTPHDSTFATSPTCGGTFLIIAATGAPSAFPHHHYSQLMAA